MYSWEKGVQERIHVHIPVLDVHELLSHLHCRLGLVTPPSKVNEYWQHQLENNVPHAINFPDRSFSHIPFSLYGDECNLGNLGDTAPDKVTAIFVALTLFKPKVIKQGHFLVCALKDSEMIHDNMETLSAILRHITWSSNVAFTGMFPSCGLQGEQLTCSKQRRAGTPLGAAFACVELKGDWLWHQRVLRLKDIPVARKICFLCEAHADDRSQLKYYDDSEDAPWRDTLVDTTTFINTKVRAGTIRYSSACGTSCQNLEIFKTILCGCRCKFLRSQALFCYCVDSTPR